MNTSREDIPELKPRMVSTSLLMPDVVAHVQGRYMAASKGGMPHETLAPMHLRMPGPVSEEIWEEARKYHDEKAMSALMAAIEASNVFNRFNMPLKTVAGASQGWEECTSMESSPKRKFYDGKCWLNRISLDSRGQGEKNGCFFRGS